MVRPPQHCPAGHRLPPGRMATGAACSTGQRARPLTRQVAARDAVDKLRLGGTPTPRSWVARMTKRPAPTGAGKSASERKARTKEIRVMASTLALYNIDRNKTGETDEAGWMTGAPWMVGRRHDRP